MPLHLAGSWQVPDQNFILMLKIYLLLNIFPIAGKSFIRKGVLCPVVLLQKNGVIIWLSNMMNWKIYELRGAIK